MCPHPAYAVLMPKHVKTVADVMTTKVLAVGPGTSIESAARLFAQRKVRGAPVVEQDGSVIGVVSLTDFADPDRQRGPTYGSSLYYSLEDGLANEYGAHFLWKQGVVADVMTPDVLSIHPNASIVVAGHRMVTMGVHRLLVVDDDRMLAGIVSVTDLVRGFVESVAA